MSRRFVDRLLDREMERLARSSPGPHLSIRRFPNYWVPHPLPGDLTGPEAMEEYARSVARKEKREVCLFVSGQGVVQFDSRGKVKIRLP